MTPRIFYAMAIVAAVAVTAPVNKDAALAQTRRLASVLGAGSLTDLRAQDDRVERMMRGGQLRLRESLPDKMLPGRRVERADQYHAGTRVFGGDVSRQIANGQTVSIFGTLYEGIDVETIPRLAEPEAGAVVQTATGVVSARGGELVVLPLDSGGYALTWKFRIVTGIDIREYFVDAATGRIIFDYSDLQTQSAVGRGTGVLGDPKKVSVQPTGGSFAAQDGLRPPSIRTYDMQGNPQRVLSALNGVITLGSADLASDSDNVWADGVAVDAHVYSGWTYDYYFKRFGRRGINDANLTMRTLIHPVRRDNWATQGSQFPTMFANAFYAGGGQMVYGVGLPAPVTSGGRTWNHLAAALDIVTHEITHGVTQFTSGLIYRDESGALNESFSDIMGTGAEFFFHPGGEGPLRADYLCGEDAVRGGASNPTSGIRSLANPSAYGHPDHYSIRFRGLSDNGGVHINSSISNHAFYLAIEGGTNRVSGLGVQGVGGSNREQIEKVFYRAFTQMLTASSNFSVARAATIQAARDLYGEGSAPELAITQAWTAVGVN